MTYRSRLEGDVVVLALHSHFVHAVQGTMGYSYLFLKPFKKGKILQSGIGVTGKYEFGHHFGHLFRLIDRMIFKNTCPKRIFRSDFVNLGSKILYLFLAGKNDRLFSPNLSDFDLYNYKSAL